MLVTLGLTALFSTGFLVNKYYGKKKDNVENDMSRLADLERQVSALAQDNKILKEENKKLQNYITHTFMVGDGATININNMQNGNNNQIDHQSISVMLPNTQNNANIIRKSVKTNNATPHFNINM